MRKKRPDCSTIMAMQYVKPFLKRMFDAEQRGRIRRQWARSMRIKLPGALSQEEFHAILGSRLEIKRGSTLLIHCSFGNLKAAFSPAEAVEVLQDLVGSEGNLLMPFYPGSGIEALEGGKIFDPRTAQISTGALARTLARSSGSRVSIHPIKAVVAWGQARDFLISTHARSRTPYDSHSPYYRMLEQVAPICVGLGTDKNSFIHACEDNVPEHPMDHYHPGEWTGRCVSETGEEIVVKTLVHKRDTGWTMGSAAFLMTTACPTYQKLTHRGRAFYKVDAREAFAHVSRLSREGVFRVKEVPGCCT